MGACFAPAQVVVDFAACALHRCPGSPCDRHCLTRAALVTPRVDYIGDGYIIGRMSKSRPVGPLTPAVFHILLALFGRERHGYDIMQQVKEDSQGAVKMGPGTLYGSLDRMIAVGLVAKSDTRDPRRIYYKLTALGQATLRAESERLSTVAATARRQLRANCP
jgi:DNA-binding MarR family transcriptional regulator